MINVTGKEVYRYIMVCDVCPLHLKCCSKYKSLKCMHQEHSIQLVLGTFHKTKQIVSVLNLVKVI